jgi:hypothetical protein
MATSGLFWTSEQIQETVVGEQLATVSRNATYTSSVIQNQLVDIAADQIRQKILDRVKKAVWYTVLADKVTDISNKEQLSVVLRYVDPDTVLVREDLISLDLSKLRGQSYNGVGNMAGTIRGTSALISAQYPPCSLSAFSPPPILLVHWLSPILA